MPTDMGALVIMVPIIDTVDEVQAAVDWTYFPPFGRRSSSGGQGLAAREAVRPPRAALCSWRRRWDRRAMS